MKYLGRTVTGSISADQLDVIAAPHSIEHVRVTSDELQAVCPVTAQPDLYRMTIDYQPAGHIIESKALKLYLTGWRDVGIMAEPLSACLAFDLASVLGVPVTCELQQQVRGGLTITAASTARPSDADPRKEL